MPSPGWLRCCAPAPVVGSGNRWVRTTFDLYITVGCLPALPPTGITLHDESSSGPVHGEVVCESHNNTTSHELPTLSTTRAKEPKPIVEPSHNYTIPRHMWWFASANSVDILASSGSDRLALSQPSGCPRLEAAFRKKYPVPPHNRQSTYCTSNNNSHASAIAVFPAELV